MRGRDFLNIAAGCAIGLAALIASANAAPLSPAALAGEGGATASGIARPAVISSDQVDRLKPEEVRWGHHWRGRHWRHRPWHWHRHHWHRHPRRW